MNEAPAQAAVLVEGMRSAILAFEEGRLRLDRLAWELKSRIAGLQQFADEAWVDEIKGIWNQLEVTNAFFIESGRETPDSDERKDVAQVIDELQAALTEY